MRPRMTLAVAAAWMAVATMGPALAGGRHADYYRPHRGLPPVAGTLHVGPRGFGGGHFARGPIGRPERFERREAFLPRPHRYGPAYGQQAGAFLYQNSAAQAPYDEDRGYPQAHAPYSDGSGLYGEAQAPYTHGYGYGASHRAVTWRGDGTGLVGLIGTAWGTADSATTGGFYPPPSPAYATEAPLEARYAEPDLWSSGVSGGLAYGGGVSAPLAYYNSGSSAGPYGTPGGLGVYSSGAYGPGPRTIHVGAGYAPSGCSCGPHVISLRHPDPYAGW